MTHIFLTVFAVALILIGNAPAYSETPQAAKDAEGKGEAANKAGDYNLAITHFDNAIRLDPKYALAYSYRGVACANKRNFEQAMADSSVAIRLDPQSTAVYIHRGWIYFDRRQFDKAISDYSEAIRIDPKCADAFIDRAQSYDFKGDYEKAMADAKEALRLEPKSHMANNTVGIAYDSYAKAVFRADDKTVDALFDQASAYFDAPPRKLNDAQQQLQFDGSMEKFRSAANKLDRASKGQLLFDYSAMHFKAAIEIKPDYDFGNSNLGVYFARPGKAHNAVTAEKYFRKAIAINPRYADAYNNLGIVLAEQGKLDEAISAHKSGLAVRPDRAFDHNNLSRVFLKKGDFENALEENSNALKCDAKFLGAWMGRAEIYEKQDELEKATKCIGEMIAIDPKSPDTIHAQGTLIGKCLELNRADDALAFLLASIKLNPAIPELYSYRAEVYLRKDDFVHAKQDFEQIKRLCPELKGVQEKIDAIQAKLDKSAKGGGHAKSGSNE